MIRPAIWWENTVAIGSDDAVLDAIINSEPCGCGDCITAVTLVGDVCLRSFYHTVHHNTAGHIVNLARMDGPRGGLSKVIFGERLYTLKTLHQAFGAGKHEGEKETVATMREIDG